MTPLARVIPLFAALALAPSAMAGLNAGAMMSASWSKDTIVQNADCAPLNTIYVRFSRAGGLTYAGGNLDITWGYGAPGPIQHDPASVTGCVAYLQSLFPHSTTCSPLNHGSTTAFETVDENEGGGHVNTSWTNSITTTGCTDGLVAEIQFESDTCSPCGAIFILNGNVYDGAAMDILASNGLLILGNPPIPVAPTTWGAIKDLMRR